MAGMRGIRRGVFVEDKRLIRNDYRELGGYNCADYYFGVVDCGVEVMIGEFTPNYHPPSPTLTMV
jgi:hypothetical protein